jgi:hypothetical protein
MSIQPQLLGSMGIDIATRTGLTIILKQLSLDGHAD